MGAISKISHASYETPDLDALSEYYTDIIGLTVTDREQDTVYLSSSIDHHCVVLRKGGEAACTRLGFQIGKDDDLDAFEKHVKGFGIETERKRDPEPSISDMLVFKDFKGTQMEVFKTPEPANVPFSEKGIIPHKLGHVAFHVKDVKEAAKFYCDVMGFKDSDWMGDFFAFLRCGPDHHTINFIGTGVEKHHHSAFELHDWAHIESSCDFLSRKGYPLIWGPGRHGIGHNLFTYHAAPNGLTIELFAELDQVNEDLGYFEPRPWHRENPQKPKVWPKGPESANLWGIAPPDDFMAP
ncbi:VOC family protein [Hoeflea sp. WL0058]|uniref:VOC family protein n=1 Tax=Flavimaribacter sediminis TaxID=2865987 RepID=A0AAE2ZPP0_9HYPH|nr:VOC family protein [Flavimaribacter sediminis]MBW8638457.1 VOC family protein [Flavimaribacter sediminis]